MSNADITYTYTNQDGTKKAIYRVSLPPNPADWTLESLRKFVADADSLAIPGNTKVRRDPDYDAFAFQADNRFYGLCLERVVNLDEPKPSCDVPGCVSHPKAER